MITKNIVSFDELLESLQQIIRERNDPTRESNQRRIIDNKLPEMELLNNKEIQTLREKYSYIMEMMARYVPEGSETDDSKILLYFSGFRDGHGYQCIAEGSVSDLRRPERNEYNFHFQNTSQWLFAFGFVFDTERRDFSVHT